MCLDFCSTLFRMYWIFHLVELRALGFMDCTHLARMLMKSSPSRTEELVLDSDASGLEANVESLECEPSGLQLEADAGTFEHGASGSQLGRSC